MVVFTCNACSAVLKRNQVDKHCYQCRRCESLSCVDCGKDFWGEDYQQHTKCISEEEKYGGKNVAPKVNKGEAKQEQWVEQVQAAIVKASSNPKLKGLLQRLTDYPNIPRKKAKFENFVKNSLRVNSTSLIAEVWDVLMTKTQDEKKQEINISGSKCEPDSITNGHDKKIINGDNQNCEEVSVPSAPKNKRERKEERRKNAEKKEKKDKSGENDDDNERPKKVKKRKRQEESEDGGDDDDENCDVQQTDSVKTNKKKKKKRSDDSGKEEEQEPKKKKTKADREENGSEKDQGNDEECPPAKRQKKKFDWDSVILAVVQKKGDITLKKLKKKVLSEYAAQDGLNYSEENLSAKFDKKVLKIRGVKVSKDRAFLKTD